MTKLPNQTEEWWIGNRQQREGRGWIVTFVFPDGSKMPAIFPNAFVPLAEIVAAGDALARDRKPSPSVRRR
jgi:hypothetical protein